MGEPDQSHPEPHACEAGSDALFACVKCDEVVSAELSLSAGRSGRICKLCYNSQRSLVDHYKKRGKKTEWDRMSVQKKKDLIKQNKNGGGIRGKERKIKLTEQVRV